MNSVSIVMESKPENIAFARVAVAAFIAPLDPSVEAVSEIKTAVSEAVTNAVIHGGADYVTMNLVSGETSGDGDKAITKTITIDVIDKGCGIADIDAAREPLFTTKGDLERSGLGFTVMESFMDEVRVESTLGEGTTVTLVKTLAGSISPQPASLE